MDKRILEAGHYYMAKGPTELSTVGWTILESMKTVGDATLLFIDDVHELVDVSPAEAALPTVEFNPSADIVVHESAVVSEAWEMLTRLQQHPTKNKRAKQSGGRWFCSGFPLTLMSGYPTCLLLDLGLCLRKWRLGFERGVNILPIFYETEQQALQRLLAKALPEFTLEVVLYDLEGTYRVLD